LLGSLRSHRSTKALMSFSSFALSSRSRVSLSSSTSGFLEDCYLSQLRERDGGGSSATHHTVVDHGHGLPDRRVIVGELQVATLARVQRRSRVRQLLHAVDPRVEVAIA